MKVYLVGGAVRDLLMDTVPQDLDYVVTGSTPQEMTSLGFTRVGADFPVFIQAETGHEYALARREIKTGEGYLGFQSEFGVDVTLEDDLQRRDLTINSIGYDIECTGRIFDPFNGKQDIDNKILRHTSDAFQEDPVRVLRLARFRARLGVGWTVADETKTLVAQMSKKGVLGELQPDRIWKELSRALMEPYPRLFFDTLLECDALHTIFPEVYRLKTALEPIRWHPESNSYEHSMLVLEQSAQLNFDLTVRLGALVHDFGKGITPRDLLPSHHGHEVKGVPIVQNFCDRLRVPAKIRNRVMHATRYHMHMHKLDQLNPKTFVRMFEDIGALNDPTVVDVLHRVGICDERGRLGSEDNPYDHLDLINVKFQAVSNVKFADVFPHGETVVTRIKDQMFRARVAAARNAKI